MKYQFTQPQILNGEYYGVGDTIDNVDNILNVEVLIQHAILIPVKAEVPKQTVPAETKTSVPAPTAKPAAKNTIATPSTKTK